MSAGEKQSNKAEALTNWRAENRQCQQGRNRATKQRHSPTGKQRTGNVSREETEQQSGGTHILESREKAMSAGEKQSNTAEALTSWKAENRQCQQGRNRATKQRHLPTGKQRTGNVSRGETEQQNRGTYILKSREQVISAGEKQSNKAEALTDWKAENGQCQQGRNRATNQGHLQTGMQRIGNVSRREIEQSSRSTYILECRGSTNLVGEKYFVFIGTHHLESQGQMMSAGAN